MLHHADSCFPSRLIVAEIVLNSHSFPLLQRARDLGIGKKPIPSRPLKHDLIAVA
jgi:hypothetical protein